MVITDSLFSMDGDVADLRGLAALRRKHGFLLVSPAPGRQAGTRAGEAPRRAAKLAGRSAQLAGHGTARARRAATRSVLHRT